MKKFKFFLVKYQWRRGGRGGELKKNLTIEAEDTPAACKKIETEFPDWQVSMFWPV